MQDAVAGVLVFLLAATIGAAYVRTVIDGGGKPRFYQGEFGPAVMAACGRGYVNPDVDALPALKAFLNLERDAFSCDNLGGGVAVKPLSPMQIAFRYQEMTIATTWRWTGVSWSGLSPLYGAMFGLTTLAAYGLFRTSAGVILSLLGAIAMAGSTIQLIYLPHFRDYSKAPFLLMAALVLAWLAIVRLSPRALVAVAAAFGVLIGIGVGFRNDLLIAMPLFVATVLFFLPGPLRERLPLKLAAIAACVASLWVTMAPMRAIYQPGGGNSMQHVILLGLGDSFNTDLGVNNGGLYSWGYTFKDQYAHAQASSYATRMNGVDHALTLYGPDYDKAVSALLEGIATSFPADMITRVYASIVRTLAIPYNTTSRHPPTLVSDPRIIRGYTARDAVLRVLGAAWPWVIGAALIGLSLANLRIALFTTLLVFYFSAYPVLQFNERHFFHLEVIAWWALLLTLQQLAAFAVGAWRSTTRARWTEAWRAKAWLAPVRVAAIVWVVAILMVATPLWAARRYQSTHVRGEIERYLSLEKSPLDRNGIEIAPGITRLTAPALAMDADDPGDDAVRSGYFVAEFAAASCETLQFDLTLHYTASISEYDFSRTIQVRPPLAEGGVRRIFASVFSHPRASLVIDGAYRLDGIDVPTESLSCLSSLSRIRDVRGLPMLLDMNLPAGWENATLFHTIDGIESRVDGEPSPDIFTFPADLPVGRSTIMRAIEPLRAEDLENRSVTLDTSGPAWRVSGAGGVGGKGPFLYLAQMKPRPAKEGEMMIAKGRLDHGGLSVGLVQDGQWIAQVPVLTPGNFVVVVRVPRDGSYAVVVANNVTGRSLDNQVTIDSIGWARP